jgi:hypothetical protein
MRGLEARAADELGPSLNGRRRSRVSGYRFRGFTGSGYHVVQGRVTSNVTRNEVDRCGPRQGVWLRLGEKSQVEDRVRRLAWSVNLIRGFGVRVPGGPRPYLAGRRALKACPPPPLGRLYEP